MLEMDHASSLVILVYDAVYVYKYIYLTAKTDELSKHLKLTLLIIVVIKNSLIQWLVNRNFQEILVRVKSYTILLLNLTEKFKLKR